MHISESTTSNYYRPKTLFREPCDGTEYGNRFPRELKESLKNFLRVRASILMSAPDLDRKTYSDHPLKHELDDSERAEDVCVPHYYSEIGWPHKWSSIGYRPASDTGEYRAVNAIDALAKQVQHSDPEMAAALKLASERMYWSSTLKVWLRVRGPKNEFGSCLEDIESKRLRGNLPDDIAQFVSVAHNALIDTLAWLDKDLPTREADAIIHRDLHQRKQACIYSEERLIASEKRHSKAVARDKAALAVKAAEQHAAGIKAFEDAQKLMDAANKRMDEAMMMAKLAQVNVWKEVVNDPTGVQK